MVDLDVCLIYYYVAEFFETTHGGTGLLDDGGGKCVAGEFECTADLAPDGPGSSLDIAPLVPGDGEGEGVGGWTGRGESQCKGVGSGGCAVEGWIGIAGFFENVGAKAEAGEKEEEKGEQAAGAIGVEETTEAAGA